MSKYTTEVRFICETASGLVESKGFDGIDSILNKAITKVFNFNYPIFDENYRNILEKKILKHFYTREIGEETVGLWKLRLDTKLNEIMPYYNQLYKSALLEFNPLYTVSTRRSGLDINNGKDVRTPNLIDTRTPNLTDTRTPDLVDSRIGDSTVDGTNKYSDTPQGTLDNIENDTYLTNATIDNTKEHNTESTRHTGSEATRHTGSEAMHRTGTEKIDKDNTRDYYEDYNGYVGISGSKLLKEFRETFLNIDMMVINDLEPLFMQLW